jgi:hypothetical protein
MVLIMCMNKALFVLIGLILLASFVFSTSISNYRVPSSVMLDQQVTAVGTFSGGAGVWCSFYVLDANTRVIVYHASDQITIGSGQFAMNPKTVSEPVFLRGSTYTVETICSDAVSDANFVVLQRESIARAGAQEFAFITSPENTDTLFIWGGIFGFIALILIIVFAVIFMKVH